MADKQEKEQYAYPECKTKGQHNFDNEDCICHSLWLQELALKQDEAWMNEPYMPWEK